MGNISSKAIDKKLSAYDKTCIDAASENIDYRKAFDDTNRTKFSTPYRYKKEQLRLLTDLGCLHLENKNEYLFDTYYRNKINQNPEKYKTLSKYDKLLKHDNHKPISNKEIEDIQANPERYKQMLKKRFGQYWQGDIEDIEPEFYVERFVDNARPGMIEELEGGKSRKHKKYKKRTKKYKRV